MARLFVETPTVSEEGYRNLALKVAQRVTSMPENQCPVDFSLSLAQLFLSESCGKCTPCRVGLTQSVKLIEAVLEGAADEEDLAALRRTAQTMYDSADCAIGFEAGRMLLEALNSFADDFECHIKTDRCAERKSHFVPCQAVCPAHVDIPTYIACINEGRYDDALRVIRNDNPLPSVCGYVCEHPCENACRRSMVDQSVNICGLKRFAVDNAEWSKPMANQPATGKRIAIIGGGPAGLTAAYYLQLMGHECTIYDQRAKLGGMVRYGIPDYRLPQAVLDKDIDFILSTGVKALVNTRIDSVSQDMMTEYDAIYLAPGAHSDKKLGLEGEDSRGVISAVEFLRAAGEGAPIDLSGKKVVVIGGGNVAMDCTRTARRLGAASVECVYRRRIADMTALQEEIDEAMAEGCQITQLMAPVRIEANEDGCVSALIAQPQMIGEVKRGRPAPYAADAPERRIECDVVLVAIGQAIDSVGFASLIKLDRDRLVTNKDASVAFAVQNEDHALIFAGGDAGHGPATVIRAIAAGKIAAANIDQALGFEHDIFDKVDVPEVQPTAPATGRVELVDRNFSEAIQDFDIAKIGMSCEAACQESGRCLHCNHHGIGAMSGKERFQW